MKVYTGNGWEIREGRWQDSAPDSVDVVVSDPPYDTKTHNNDGGAAVFAGSGFGGAGRFLNKRKIDFDPLDSVQELAAGLIDIACRWVVCFCSIEMVGKYADGAGDKRWIRGGVWTKPDAVPQLSGDRPAVFGDAIAIMHREGRKRWNCHGKPAHWRHCIERKDRCHPTQKPIPLMLDLVAAFSDPGELVWDPYCGSGTTGVACLRLGRRFLGHEMQPHYAAIAAERLAAEERGLTLQDVNRGQTSIMDLLTDGA